jgi:molybdopterin converting factor subunit 1
MVRLFARARDLAGCDMLSVELPPEANVAELRRQLIVACPALREFLPRCAVAVGEDFVTDDAVVTSASEVAIIPPVSGGEM